MIVVAIDDIGRGLKVVDIARVHFPQASLVVRARNAEHRYQLHERGVQHIERETLESALMSGLSVLELMGWQPHAARNHAWRFRTHSIELMRGLATQRSD